MAGKAEIFSKVVSGGYCIGCGGCAAMVDKLQMQLNPLGMYEPYAEQELSQSEASTASHVCPFLETGGDETALAKPLYSEHCEFDERIGYFGKNYAGYVAESVFRASGSSGGFGTWLPAELIQRDLVDAVIHVKELGESPKRKKLFEYTISYSVEEVLQRSKSRYYPIELSGVMRMVREKDRRYAIVGLPCFIKSVRLIQKIDSVIKERVQFCIGLVCGHLKSAAYGEMLSWQKEIDPNELVTLDFRHKEPGFPANQYFIKAVGRKNGSLVEERARVADLFGGNWGWGLFKYQACDYCDDVLAETADVVLGDAWLPEYKTDSEGTNVVLVRNAEIQAILDSALESGRISLTEITPDQMAQSQDAGLRHRREGLAFRLAEQKLNEVWAPKKRVAASTACAPIAQRKYAARIKIAKESHLAFREARKRSDLQYFYKRMESYVLELSAAARKSRLKRLLLKAFAKIKRIRFQMNPKM